MVPFFIACAKIIAAMLSECWITKPLANDTGEVKTNTGSATIKTGILFLQHSYNKFISISSNFNELVDVIQTFSNG